MLKNKNIFITGGGKGIGYHIAKRCIEEGASVLICGRNLQQLENAVETLGRDKCRYMQFDVSVINELPTLLEKAKERLQGPIDALICNAGVSLHEGNILHVSEEGYDMQFDTNFKSCYFLSKDYIKMKMQEQLDGNLIFISSETGSGCDDIPYGLTKSMINSLTGALSRRVYQMGIRVNAIAPGVTLTDMTKDFASSDNGNIGANNASGRYFLPEEVAEVACFLLSDASKCISGEIIHCDAGNHLKVNREDVCL